MPTVTGNYGHPPINGQTWQQQGGNTAGNNDLNRINVSTRVITPNVNSINSDWTQYKTTVRDIENATGYNLLSNLRGSLQDSLETRMDNQ